MSGFAAPPAAEPPLREQLSDLMERRSALEEEVSGIVAELQSPGPGGAPAAGLDAPLVDREGFPRADIDVYRVTHQRQRLAFIRTDHKEITGQIEKLLHELHAADAAAGGEAESKTEAEPAAPVVASAGDAGWAPAWYKPFALVDEVSAGSPAEAAGLRLGDEVLSLGAATLDTCAQGLQPVVAAVQASLDREMRVVVVRNCARVLLKLTPRAWAGRGVMGCHLKPSRGSVTEWPASYRRPSAS